jgi:hypothetical protein
MGAGESDVCCESGVWAVRLQRAVGRGGGGGRALDVHSTLLWSLRREEGEEEEEVCKEREGGILLNAW